MKNVHVSTTKNENFKISLLQGPAFQIFLWKNNYFENVSHLCVWEFLDRLTFFLLNVVPHYGAHNNENHHLLDLKMKCDFFFFFFFFFAKSNTIRKTKLNFFSNSHLVIPLRDLVDVFCEVWFEMKSLKNCGREVSLKLMICEACLTAQLKIKTVKYFLN